MVLLVDGPTFAGAVLAIPAGAAPTDLAQTYREEDPVTIEPDGSAERSSTPARARIAA